MRQRMCGKRRRKDRGAWVSGPDSGKDYEIGYRSIGKVTIILGGREMRSILRIPSDDMAGDAKRRVPIHYYTRRKDEKQQFFEND